MTNNEKLEMIERTLDKITVELELLLIALQ
jgi:hypothetical protein